MKKTPKEWLDDLEILCRNSGDVDIADARQMADEIERQLFDVHCGAVEGGISLRTKFDYDLLSSSQRVPMREVMSVSKSHFSYAFVNDPSIGLARAKQVVAELKTRCTKHGFGATMAIRMGATGWLVQVLGMNRADAHELIWDCWAAETNVRRAELKQLKKLSAAKCGEFDCFGSP